MLVPYNTDAPIYHLPIATIGLIVVNVVVYFLTMGAVENELDLFSIMWLFLEPDHISPLQWVTNNFMHADIMHLVGNMFFLWGFGLVTEGKLGWWRFLTVYMLIGVSYGAIIQFILYFGGIETYVLGASAVIFGLMGLAIIWAPKNDLSCLLFISFWVRTVEIPIQVFGMIYLAFQLLPLFFGGLDITSEFLHLTGLAIGVPVGILMLRWDWVDCEGWDLFNVLRGTNTRTYSESKVDAKSLLEQAKKKRMRAAAETAGATPPNASRSEADPQRSKAERSKSERSATQRKDPARRARESSLAQESLANALDAGHLNVAMALYQREQQANPEVRLPPRTSTKLIAALHREKRFRESIPIMRDLVTEHPEKTIAIRIKLAKILLQVEKQPRQAVRLLKEANAWLKDNEREQAKAIVTAAKKALDNGV